MANYAKAPSATATLHYDQLPQWMKIDPYIRLGYRRQLNSFYECFKSLFYLHNEFVNIWSHLLPAIVYCILVLKPDLYAFPSSFKVTTTDMVILRLHLLCTVCCLLFSALYHCTNSHSEHISRYFLKMDYLGILLGVMGTNSSAAYFGFYGNLFWQVFYILLFIMGAAFVFYLLLRYNMDGPGACLRRYLSSHPCPHM